MFSLVKLGDCSRDQKELGLKRKMHCTYGASCVLIGEPREDVVVSDSVRFWSVGDSINMPFDSYLVGKGKF